jgi:hypothetical protein
MVQVPDLADVLVGIVEAEIAFRPRHPIRPRRRRAEAGVENRERESLRRFSSSSETSATRREFFACLKAGKSATCAMCPSPITA